MVFTVAVAVSWGVGSQLGAPAPHPVTAPDDLAVQSFVIESHSGSRVHGWTIDVERSRGVVVLLHGIRTSRMAMISRARLFNRHGYSVVMIDFQGHGESSGTAITAGFLERFDAEAAVAHALASYPGQPVAVLGVSMGGAAALLASPLTIDSLILESVYPDIRTAIQNRVRQHLGFLYWLPGEILLAQLKFRLGIHASDMRPVDSIAQIDCPILLISGATDRHTTPANTQALFEQAPPGTSLWMVDGAAHVDFHAAAAEEYERKVLRFVEESFGDAAP